MSQLYPIRYFGDPILRRVSTDMKDVTQQVRVPGFEPVDMATLSRNMLDTMYEAHGVGLAAPQIGLPIRMFVAAEYDDDVDEGEGQSLKARVQRELVMINPALDIIDVTQEKAVDGCLSMPGIYADDVPRHKEVRFTYLDLDGQTQTLETDDYLARVLQHEYDHLDGTLFFDHLPKSAMSQHRQELGRLQREAKAYLKYIRASM